MKMHSATISERFSSLCFRIRSKLAVRKYTRDAMPFQLELFSAEHMAQHGGELACSHSITTIPQREVLLRRLEDNETLLLDVHGLLIADNVENQRVTPASEWLLDNFYILEEQIRMARRHLPKGYSRELPHLANGHSVGLPRVYDIALEIISHTEGRVDLETLESVLAAYQSVTPLTLGELWAIPIMLRLALIENIRRLAALIAIYRADRSIATYWAKHITLTAAKNPQNLIIVVADMARSHPPLTSPFVAELSRRLRDMGPDLALPLNWVEQQLTGLGQTMEQTVHEENRQQASNQVFMSNCFSSLRILGGLNWKAFVESMSIVEATLGGDPGGVYARMDFASRDQYRHVVEKIARRSPLSEHAVARKAVELAELKDSPHTHVGFYLIGAGRSRLEKEVSFYGGALAALRAVGARMPLSLYVGSILLLTIVFVACFAAATNVDEFSGRKSALLLLLFLGVSQLATVLVNWVATLFVTPRMLPRMDFSHGIPEHLRTMVVVPAMLTGTEAISKLCTDLEIRFLANHGPFIHFALLTDLLDSATETRPEDALLIDAALQGVIALNAKYPATGGEQQDTFFLFHRPRLWNDREGVWMGRERKRGKLEDVNALLRGRGQDRFSAVEGNTSILPGIRYVVTLDTDTQLARDSVRQFVGAMAHPLSRGRCDAKNQLIVEGYGILQPRVASSLSGTNRSPYARMCASESGIDQYSRTISDVYQDLFSEGSYIGKGIYDVDIFEQSLRGRLPDNRILSHDLLEGCYARSGFLSDVQLYEDPPSRYRADAARRQRWTRGDWQIAPWILPFVPVPIQASVSGSGVCWRQNPLSMLSRWKICDNLRRSLIPVALPTLLFVGWLGLERSWLWTLMVFALVFLPSLLTSTVHALRKTPDLLLGAHVAACARETAGSFARTIVYLACLPFEAATNLVAIGHSLWRVLFSKKLLLQWDVSTNSDSVTAEAGEDLKKAIRDMWIGPFSAIAGATTVYVFNITALPAAIPVLVLWFVSPLIVWRLSLPFVHRQEKLAAAQTVFLHKLARKTWGFFEFFVGYKDNWLPPDNYQEYPAASLAHRTSPTNMGLALLANLSAYDFGFISVGRCLRRTAKTLGTMNMLERHRGHFFNWYDTQSCAPLRPRYISSVDSGNLAGHLLVLRSGLQELGDRKIVNPQMLDGLRSALALAQDTAKSSEATHVLLHELNALVDTYSADFSLEHVLSGLEQLSLHTRKGLAALSRPDGIKNPHGKWLRAFVRQVQDAIIELRILAPWAGRLSAHHATGEFSELETVLTLRETAGLEELLVPRLVCCRAAKATGAETACYGELEKYIIAGSRRAQARLASIQKLAGQCVELSCMDYSFLYNPVRKLLSIGYNIEERKADSSYYDLLASEARLAVFVGISQGQLPQESWFALGRLLTSAAGKPVLLSWSGSMFEYLMPLLIMPSYDRSLLDESCRATVAAQIDYGKKRNVPWGISESGYNLFDAHYAYQYRAFGVPGLGLRRGLAEDLVIAPYASVLALLTDPKAACLNIEKLACSGFEGQYGLYEAVDYTSSRLPRGESLAIVRSFMAHHQGMSLLALASLLLDQPMQKRFAADPGFQATMLLLQERIPEAVISFTHTAAQSEVQTAPGTGENATRFFDTPYTAKPSVQLLSNGRYHVMISNAGGGYSRWKDLAVTRWREDGVRDNWGTFCYIRDLSDGAFWSTTSQPVPAPRVAGDQFGATFSEGRAEFHIRCHGYESHTDIVVSPEDDIELRRTRISNLARTRRTLDVTSYAEVVLASAASDASHPAFSNLFVQTEIIRPQQAILCTRRPRSENDVLPCMLHMMTVHGITPVAVSYETDRRQFIGRERTTRDPRVMDRSVDALSDSEGSVLDPVVAVRSLIILEAGQSVTIDIISGVGENRAAALALIAKYSDRGIADHVFGMAWTHSQIMLRQINATEAEAQMYNRLAGSVVYADASMRAENAVLLRNNRGQSGLWGHAISGDVPIVLLQIENPEHIELVRQLLHAHVYWRLRGLSVDLVIWNEDGCGYRQALQDQIMSLLTEGDTATPEKPGGIFIRSGDRITVEDRILIQTVARVVIRDCNGTLAEQTDAHVRHENTTSFLAPTRKYRSYDENTEPVPRTDLIFFNGMGGFTPDGREYVTTTSAGRPTPAPWVNVLANPQFGTVISETGLAYTWSENAHEFRLTPWANDPVSDCEGEAYYLRDEEDGYFWSPTPRPCRGKTPYTARHGFGYSVFEHTEHGIASELFVYVAVDAPVKFAVLKVRNTSERSRVMSATGYVAWVLGDLPAKTAMHIVTSIDRESGALFACNPYNTEFSGRTAFFDTDDSTRSISCDRAEFIGRNGTLTDPAAMKRLRLSGRIGAAIDPCAAIQVPFSLAVGEERTISFRLGVGQSTQDAEKLVRRFRGTVVRRETLAVVWRHWTQLLGAVYVETPDPAFNVLANGWLLYQTIACRLWGRSATYQSGGAFGFRDQLQDAMALVHTAPCLLREQILSCAAHQFVEGDVLHWWHPPVDRGVRTRCSDDYLWLPLATCRYVHATRDSGVLATPIAFIQGRLLRDDEDSYYDLPSHSDEMASLYEHCVRAIRCGLRFGSHGLPLIGSGDWNDGMDMVGRQGKGESVWLGFFLYDVLTRFSPLAAAHGDTAFAEQCSAQAYMLRQNIEAHGWDGNWYRRAYFDDGSPLGSSKNAECQIDSIAQSWSVLSGAGASERTLLSMEALDKHLVNRAHGLVRLLEPPFDSSALNPGYIRGYAPGVRENGGQYTHAAIWAAMAFAKLGDSQRAWELFDLINPVNHGRTAEEIATYRAEPYVMAADVYALPPHTGRGGWTWYTGSAAWMYRLLLESLLGLQLEGDVLRIAPCLPAGWNHCTVHYRYIDTVYHIEIRQNSSEPKVLCIVLDGNEQQTNSIPLANDHNEHFVWVN